MTTRDKIIEILDKHIPEFGSEVHRYTNSLTRKMDIVSELFPLIEKRNKIIELYKEMDFGCQCDTCNELRQEIQKLKGEL